MTETRVNKYKNYRNSLTKREGEVFASYTKHKINKKTADEVLNETRDETPSISTLSISYEHIYNATKDKEEKSLLEIKQRKKHIIKNTLIISGCVLLLTVIVVIAFLIF